MSLARTLANNTGLQMAGKLLSTLLGFVAIAIMSRSLNVEHMGWYFTASNFLQFIGIASDFGFTVTTSNMLAEPEADQKKTLNTLFTWRIITAFFFYGLAPIGILFFPYPQPIKIAVALMSLSFFAVSLNQVIIGYYRQQLAMMHATIGEVLGRVLLVVGLLFGSWYSWGFIPAMITVSLAAIFNTWYCARFLPSIRLEIDRTITKRMFVKMWPTALAVIFNAFYLQGDRIILPLHASQEIVAYYGYAYRVLDIVIQTAAIIMGLMMPLITYAWSRSLKDDFRRYCQISLDLLSVIILPILVASCILATPLMRFIGGAQFANAGAIMMWLSFSMLGICFGMVFGHVALALDQQKQALWIYASDAVISTVAYLYFIPRFGWIGAAGVTIFSELYAAFFLARLSIKTSGIAPHLFTVLKICLACVPMSIALLLTKQLPFIIPVLIGSLVYGASLLLLRVVPLSLIREIIFKKSLLKA